MGSIVKGVFGGGDAAKDAASIQAQAGREGVAEQRRQFDVTQANIQPFQQAGVGALGQEQALLGLAGQQAQQQALDAFQLSPGQEFLRQQGEQARIRNAAATGGLGGGNVQRELETFGQGLASQALGEQLNRLASLRGGGQTAVTNLGQFGAQSAGNIQQGLAGVGQAQASGILGEQQAQSQLVQQGLTAALAFSDRRLKKNIKKIGFLSSGLAWYAWDWIDDAIDMVRGQDSQGVMADEAREMFPDAVFDVGGILKVSYMGIE